MHLVGMRIAEMVDPGARIETVRFNYQYVALPMRGRESPPSEKIRIVGKFSAVQPDGAQPVTPLEMLVDSIGQLNELDGVGIDQGARYAFGIAILIRVSSVRVGNSTAPADGFFRCAAASGLPSKRP